MVEQPLLLWRYKEACHGQILWVRHPILPPHTLSLSSPLPSYIFTHFPSLPLSSTLFSYRCLFNSKNQEKHPLLTEIGDNLTDARQDITVIGQILRRNIITCILLGIQQSVCGRKKGGDREREREREGGREGGRKGREQMS